MTHAPHPLLVQVEAFTPYDDRAHQHLQLLRQLLTDTPAPLSRDQYVPGHVTASAFVLSPDGSSLLLIHHRKLGLWLQPGGHIDDDDASLQASAAREASEETGLGSLRPLQAQPLDIDVHDIPELPPFPAHRHYDVRFAFQAGFLELQAQKDEVWAARWAARAELARWTTDLSVLRTAARLDRL